MRRSNHHRFWLVCVDGAFRAACNPRKRRSNKTVCLQGKDLFLGVAADLVTASRVTL